EQGGGPRRSSDDRGARRDGCRRRVHGGARRDAARGRLTRARPARRVHGGCLGSVDRRRAELAAAGRRGGAVAGLILDCDPGHDDAVAILLALASPEASLDALTTVAGNQTLDKTTANALRVLEFAGRGDVPVAAGADRPLVRQRHVAANVHGETGLDGPELPRASCTPVGQHAVDFLAAHVAGRT